MLPKVVMAVLILAVGLGVVKGTPKTAGAEVIGEIKVSGTFTLDPTYDFNNFFTGRSYGTFADVIVSGVSGLFAPYVLVGDAFDMNTTAMLINPCCAAYDNPLVWSVGGYTMDVTLAIAAGANPRTVAGNIDLTGNGFDPDAFKVEPFNEPATVVFNFRAPAETGFPTQAVTGPLDLRIEVY
jgi:hypothetical protein